VRRILMNAILGRRILRMKKWVEMLRYIDQEVLLGKSSEV
jgi:hypothetical protein